MAIARRGPDWRLCLGVRRRYNLSDGRVVGHSLSELRVDSCHNGADWLPLRRGHAAASGGVFGMALLALRGGAQRWSKHTCLCQ